ncbi:hypothetical protein E4U42_006723 [Claviceps africana]|uniref:Uncharacterized protein n=1 Tax=Claviceps africana TaxID=83212 RepID=A0A8K0J2M8_9HYPO|nr:hypothetical protein E4U42_006723 [Claviceps africana]
MTAAIFPDAKIGKAAVELMLTMPADKVINVMPCDPFKSFFALAEDVEDLERRSAAIPERNNPLLNTRELLISNLYKRRCIEVMIMITDIRAFYSMKGINAGIDRDL